MNEWCAAGASHSQDMFSQQVVVVRMQSRRGRVDTVITQNTDRDIVQ